MLFKRYFLPLLKKYLLVFVLLLLTQLLFGLFNLRIFHVENFEELMNILWGNIRFGLASTTLFLLPWLAMSLLPIRARWRKGYRVTAETLYYLGALLLLMVNLVDSAYYQFTYRRMNAMMFKYMSIGGEMGTLLPKFIVDYWYATLSAVMVTFLLIWGNRRINIKSKHTFSQPSRQGIIGSIISIVAVFLLLRGGFERKWISPGESVRYAQPKNSALVLNSPYNIVYTIKHLEPTNVEYMTPTLAAKLYSPDYEPLTLNANSTLEEAASMVNRHPETLINTLLQMTDPQQLIDSNLLRQIQVIQELATKPKNVIIVVLESFSQEYMGCYNKGGTSYTPFLDGLAKQSLCFQGRSNGKESIESIPAILASIPSWSLCPFIMSEYYKDTIDALPSILKRHGYSTAFYHGSYNGTMNFDKFCYKAGIDKYHGKNEYIKVHGDKAYDGTWGIFDEPFLKYTLEEINKMTSPFFASIFTISSHHPYSIPEEHKGQFPKGKHPLLQTVAYTDYALQQFFDAAKKQPWYANTLFVILGDHPGQGLSRQYNDYSGWYCIPMILFDPSNTSWASMSNDIVQQIDVMPTVLDYLNINERVACFGESALRHSNGNHGWHVVFGNDYHQLERNGRIAILSPYKTLGTPEDIEYLKAVLQTYTSRLLGNQLVKH
ncbi:MAG: sulfatase-like hydrolase/transferase [Bacteroidales bacterium]|nr:sulfatase-like hydrolase/transferase [Bacteroidales bacterium]